MWCVIRVVGQITVTMGGLPINTDSKCAIVNLFHHYIQKGRHPSSSTVKDTEEKNELRWSRVSCTLSFDTSKLETHFILYYQSIFNPELNSVFIPQNDGS